MDERERQARLSDLARRDEAYALWAKCYQNCSPQFEAYANAQPEDVRNILWGYAESGRLMNQRIVNLACEYLVFPDEK